MTWKALVLVAKLWFSPTPTPALCLLPAGEEEVRMQFDEAWNLTMTWEGGDRLHRVPGDPGGLTKYGISARAYPDEDIAGLTAERAKMFAHRHYWARLRASYLPAELRWHVFDMGFNAGVAASARMLQQSVNLCREARGAHTYIRVDGQIGPKTLAAVAEFPPDRLARVFKAYRISHYLRLADAGRARFIHGWLRRAEGEPNA